MNDWIKYLRGREQPARQEKTKTLTLVEEIREWWEQMNEVEQMPFYSMSFLIKRFGPCPAQIGPALYELGWERKRVWKPGKPFRRYWVPPQTKS